MRGDWRGVLGVVTVTGMRVLNVRYGLATNSSSTHSLVFLPPGVRSGSNDADGQTYGWDFFQLTDPASKRAYLAQSLAQQLRESMSAPAAAAIARDWTGVEPEADGNVDHQSELTFPMDWEGKPLDRDFFMAFRDFALRDDMVICGGNDNTDEKPDALEAGGRDTGMFGLIPLESYKTPTVARRDGSYWTLFNRENGHKTRLTFEGTEWTGMPARSTAPELVDVKITGHCTFGCEFCYQDSTPEGKHGDVGWIRRLAYALAEMRVFEVAIGGGEPTLHPEFVDILRAFRSSHVVPNFTTKNLAWLRDAEKRAEILALAGAFAYSVETAKDVDALAKALEAAKIDPDPDHRGGGRATVQHVVGVADEKEFRAILNACAENGIPLTLLGYKMVGRGPSFGTKPNSKWLDIVASIAKKKYMRVGIDTALADRHWDDLLKAGVPPYLMTRKEGQFSCYIDAVERKIDVSSYSGGTGVVLPQWLDAQSLTAAYRDLPR